MSETVQVKTGYELFWREQKLTKNLSKNFLGNKMLVPVVEIAFPYQHMVTVPL
jgi:hypothetical protein